MARKRGGVFEKGVDTPNAHYDTVPEIMVHEGSKLFFILGYFLHFYPLNNWKNQNLKRMKKNSWRYLHFTQMDQKSWSYAMLFLRCVADVMVSFHFGSFFYRFYPPPLPPNSQKNQNLKKMKKNLGYIIILWMCTKNYDQIMNGSWDMVWDTRLFKSFEFGNGSRMSDENLVMLEFKYLQNKKW